MQLYYGVQALGTIERADAGWLDSGVAVVARVQPRSQAPAGAGRRSSLGRVWCVVRHDGACRLTLTPIVDGVVRDDLAETQDFAASAIVIDEVPRLKLTEPLIWPGQVTSFSRQALQGIFATVRAELQPLPIGEDPPAGAVYALGGFELEARPLGVSGIVVAEDNG